MAEPRIYQGKTTVKIKQMNPDDVWLGSHPGSSQPFDQDFNNRLMDALNTPDSPNQFQYVHQKEEPDVSGTYSTGGSVRKFGSSTHVTCKKKG